MRLFRSEEHVQDAEGAVIPVTQLAELAHAWWCDRLDPDWRPHTREQNAAILEAVGLTDDFWRLP
jgi:hypothetical protein